MNILLDQEPAPSAYEQMFDITDLSLKVEFDSKNETKPASMSMRVPGNREQVSAINLSDETLRNFVETLEPDNNGGNGDSVSGLQKLKQALGKIEAGGGIISESCAKVSEILDSYQAHLNSPKRELPRLIIHAFKDQKSVPLDGLSVDSIISLVKQPNSLVWVDLTGSSEAIAPLLEPAHQLIDASPAKLATYFKKGRPITASPKKDHLVVSLKDLLTQKGSKLDLIDRDVHAIVAQNFLITVHERPCGAIRRVQNELSHSEDIRKEELRSPNYLFARILGGLLHRHWERLMPFEREARKIARLKNVHATPQLLEHVDGLTRNLRTIADSVLGIRQVMDALREKKSLYGATIPKDTLPRYESLVSDIVNKCTSLEENIQDHKQSWLIGAQERVTSRVNKLTILAGAIAIPSAVFGFFGQNFTSDFFSNPSIIFANTMAVVTSGILLTYLAAEHFFRSLNGKKLLNT